MIGTIFAALAVAVLAIFVLAPVWTLLLVLAFRRRWATLVLVVVLGALVIAVPAGVVASLPADSSGPGIGEEPIPVEIAALYLPGICILAVDFAALVALLAWVGSRPARTG